MAKIKEIGHARFNVEPAGVQNGKDHLENQSSNTMKVTLHLPHDPAISLLDVYPEEMKAYIHTKRIFIDTSLINHRAESPDVHQHETDKLFVIKPHNRLLSPVRTGVISSFTGQMG